MSDADTTANTTADPAANTNTNIDTDTDLLNDANACHDADVPRGAAGARGCPRRRPRGRTKIDAIGAPAARGPPRRRSRRC